MNNIEFLNEIIKNKKYDKILILNEDNELTIWGQAIEELLNFYKERKNG